jgi:hypothetical protein
MFIILFSPTHWPKHQPSKQLCHHIFVAMVGPPGGECTLITGKVRRPVHLFINKNALLKKPIY